MKQFASYEEENIHYWTNRASGYSGVNQEELASSQKTVWRGLISQRIAARFPGKNPSQIRVLDVGTGPGFFAIILAELGYRVKAVDYTASMLEEAKDNAGVLAKKIDFRQMNAEELTFPTASFDVLVTRNVTWNLPNPEKAYAQWMRVLKPGGPLLNFDANWYRYLWDEDAQAAHAQDRENLQASDVRDETAGTDVDAMEAIARKTPLSKPHRPAWDLDVLRGLGMQAAADTEVWKQVWTKEERINNASTPMFLVEGHKVGVPTFVSKLPATLLLTALSIGMTVVISVPLGVLAAVRHDRLTDYFLRFFSFVGNSLPNFFVALLLMQVFSIRLISTGRKFYPARRHLPIKWLIPFYPALFAQAAEGDEKCMDYVF